MAPLAPFQSSNASLPSSSGVVIIGGGIVGLMAALALRARNVPVTLLEKGRIGAEQSSRNLGWIRKTSRAAHDLPLAIASDALWAGMAERLGQDVGYRRGGIMFLSPDEAALDIHRAWMNTAREFNLDTRILNAAEIDALVPGGRAQWAGGIYTASDGCAEPNLATGAAARAAVAAGVTILENCAARSLSFQGGRAAGVVTEQGEIRCEQVLLAGGQWSRRFLGNAGISLPTLPLVLSVFRTAPVDGPGDCAVGGPDFSFRKRMDGGYTISQRGALEAPITRDHLTIGMRYLPMLRTQHKLLRIRVGRDLLEDIATPRTWRPDAITPFERVRTRDPLPNAALNREALANLVRAWPAFRDVRIVQSWAGMMDITPDSLPVIGEMPRHPGLVVASGFSGHGFGTAPAAGQLAADILMNTTPIVDPTPYRIERLMRSTSR